MKKKMSNENMAVGNVHGNKEQEEYQAKLTKKAQGLVAYMNEEPKAQLVPTLQVTERGIIPDARIVLLGDEKEDDTDTSEGVEDAGEGDAEERSDPTEATEPAKA